jgi:hypothetical protein
MSAIARRQRTFAAKAVTVAAMPDNDPVDLVERQVRAYQAFDLDAFCACYAANVVIEDADGQVAIEGQAALRERYVETFAQRPRAEILGRLAAGSWVADHERVHLGEREVELLVTYHVQAGRIDRVRMLLG